MSTTPGGSAVARGSYPRGVSRVLRLPTRPGTAPDSPSARLEREPARELPVEPPGAGLLRCANPRRAQGPAHLRISLRP
jgi:hypothetical protein